MFDQLVFTPADIDLSRSPLAGKVGSNMQYPDVPDDKQRAMIAAEQMLRGEDIAAGVEFLLTQPTRSVIQQIVIVPRALEGE